MLFLKIAGSALILSAALYASVAVGAYERKALEVLEGFWRLINYTKNRIDLYCAPRETIMKSAAKESDLGLDILPDESFYELVSRCGAYLDPKAKKELLSFDSELGEAYRDEQIKKCDYYASLIDSFRRETQEKLPGKIKMDRTLIMSLSIGIILVLW